ncbi:MAG: glycosyltransferase [Aliifodinibius sp.]|nr:glycosyltransferase family 4 protein [Fodinibius sp.]NIY29947.1 glycosyltransferase [Fodinibius sp.]
MKALFIASEFPPLQQNVTRTTKFVKYLDRSCCEPLVLTINKKSMEAVDHTFDKEIPDDLKIYRAFFPNIFANTRKQYRLYKKELDNYQNTKNVFIKCLLWLKILLRRRIPGVIKNLIWQNFLIPDNRMPWIPFAVCKGIKICREENIDVIYSSAPCYSNHIVAWIIKGALNKKWVADYRDLWTTTLYRHYGSGWRKRLEKGIERRLVDKMDAILVVTDTMKSIMLKKYAGLNENRIKVITNGYDPDDFKDITEGTSGNEFIISYTGVIYSSYKLDCFLHGIGDLIKEKPDLKREIKILFIGDINSDKKANMVNIIKNRDLIEIIRLEGKIPRAQALEVQKNSSLLLFHLSPEMTESGAVSSKLYDYWAAEKPILALLPSGSLAAEYVIKSNTGCVVDPHDSEAIKNAVWSYYQEFQSGSKTYRPNMEFISKFDRRELARQLNGIFDSLSGSQ